LGAFITPSHGLCLTAKGGGTLSEARVPLSSLDSLNWQSILIEFVSINWVLITKETENAFLILYFIFVKLP